MRTKRRKTTDFESPAPSVAGTLASQADGKLLLTVRYGAKAIEFEKGKDAVLLADVEELAVVLPKLIAATEAGELDTQIDAITKSKPIVTKR